MSSEAEQFTCSICLDFASVHPKRDYLVNTKCGHIFHFLCIQQQFDYRRKQCPICRKDLIAQDLRRLNGVALPELKRMAFRSGLQCGERKSMKIVILGNSGTGKTQIIHRFAYQEFKDVLPTTPIDMVARNIDVGGERLRLVLWDTVGQERLGFGEVVSTIAREAHGIILAYDITNSLSLENIEHWLKFAKDYGPEDSVKILVGNKTDLEDDRKVTKFVGQAVAEKLGIPFYELSAKTGSNVDLVIRKLVANILQCPAWCERGRNTLQLVGSRLRNLDACTNSCAK